MEKARAQINMAIAISEINNTTIERMDLNHIKLGDINTYILDVWYSDGKNFGIRSDCTIVER